MLNTFEKIEDLSVHIKRYVDNRIEYTKLNVAEKVSEVLGNLISGSLLFLLFLLFLVFSGVAFAFYLSEVTGKFYWGFLIVGSIYLAIGLIVWLFKKPLLQHPIMNSILNQIFNKQDHEAH
jgi:hypothetical protein